MNESNYNDIINMKYPNPEIEKAFPDKILRAAQFAPFAALTGHDEAVKETARLTDRRINIDESRKDEINRKLNYIRDHISDEHMYSFTYFVADKKKNGGKYVTITGLAIKIKEYEGIVVMDDNTEIPITDILEIKSNIFSEYE